ncbi:MAG TPA: RNA methyltransferase, partial [Arachidicoccus sp.]
VLAINEDWIEEIPFLQQSLYLKKAGVAIGEIKNKGLVPAHDLAVSTIFAKDIARVELDKAQSLQYLKRKDVELDSVQKGWTLAAFEGVNLGWMKLLPNRVNNYYPNEWRILKD